jgi:XRE family transcriptional regulator
MENPMKDKLYDDVMAEVFRDDPALAVESLNTLLEEGCTQGELLVILRQLAQAQGGISQISARAGLNEKSLYRTLSGQGNPRLSSLNAILHALGLRLAVVPLAHTPHPENAPQTSPADAAAVAA